MGEEDMDKYTSVYIPKFSNGWLFDLKPIDYTRVIYVACHLSQIQGLKYTQCSHTEIYSPPGVYTLLRSVHIHNFLTHQQSPTKVG